MCVLSCSRTNCENMLCDTYVRKIGYICNDCQSEFAIYLKKNGLNPTTEGQITEELNKFMSISKDSYTNDVEITVDEFFNSRR